MKHFALLLALAGLASACKSEPKLIIPPGQQVIINANHRHSLYCGHYRYGGRWYYIPQHVHGINCSHEIEAGVWVLEE